MTRLRCAPLDMTERQKKEGGVERLAAKPPTVPLPLLFFWRPVMSSGAQRSRDISTRHNIPLHRVKGKRPNGSDNLNCPPVCGMILCIGKTVQRFKNPDMHIGT
jgi:hypothetical protein